MSFDQNGNYTRWQGPDRCKNDRDADINILASRMDDDLNDMGDALNEVALLDGRKPMTGPLNMGGSRIKNLGPATQLFTMERSESGAKTGGGI